MLYDISANCYFPATIDSPGLVEENKTKPAIAKEIEGVDEAQSPETCAAKLVKGLESNHTYITSDILGDLFRNSMRGIVKPNYWLLDPLLWLIAPVSRSLDSIRVTSLTDCGYNLATNRRWHGSKACEATWLSIAVCAMSSLCLAFAYVTRASSLPSTKSTGTASLAPSRSEVFASISFYLVAALVMIMVNKWVLNAVSIPLFFLLVQLVTAVLLLYLVSLIGFFRIPRFRMSTIRGLLPLIGINCLGLILNTYCLQYVDASFYQVARGLVLPMTTALSATMLKSKPSIPVLCAIGIVCFGFFVGISGETIGVTKLGIALGICSSATTAVHAVIVKNSLTIVAGSALDLAYLQNLYSAIVLLPLAILVESATLRNLLRRGGSDLKTFTVGSIITGIFGFLICIAGFISIKVTSPVTHMISAAFRGVIQTCLGVWIFNDVVTQQRLSGISLILIGSVLYTWLRDRELTRQRDAGRRQYRSKSPTDIDEKAHSAVKVTGTDVASLYSRR